MNDVVIKCNFENKKYYSDEFIDVICSVRNSGTLSLDDLNICLDESCVIDSLGIGESKKFDFRTQARENAIFSVESGQFFRKEALTFSIVYSPNIYVTELHPLEVEYNTNTDVSFFVNSDFEARNVIIEIEKAGTVSFPTLSGKKPVNFSINSKKLISGVNLHISYEDSIGKKYIENKNYPLVVKNVPFYAKWLAFLR